MIIFKRYLLIFTIYLNFIDQSSSGDTAPHWNYGTLGPDVWVDLYPTCGGSAQSPINIKTACTTYQSFPAFQFSSAYDVEQKFVLTNNGHTITGEQVNASAYPLTISGGGLAETYTFVNFHLHWGENYNSGSEHQLNGKKFAGEIHFVHANANKTKNAVLGIFMHTNGNASASETETGEHRRRKRRINKHKREVLNTSNETITEWEEYFTVGETLEEQTNKTEINLRLASLLGTHLDKFYRYEGSLTTPPCSEVVTWTVFETPIDFTETEINAFRTHIFYEDYRGPQPLNNRTVYRNFPNATLSSIPDYNCCAKSADQPRNSTAPNNSAKSTISTTHILFIYFLSFIFNCIFV